MPDHDRNDSIVNAETHHEKSDVNVRALLWSVAIFIIFAAMTHAVLYLQFHYFARLFRNEASQPLTMMTPASPVPVAPRLQPFPNEKLPPNVSTPATDMDEMRVAAEKALNEPGWVDRQKGVVRLPIEVAKHVVVQRG